MGKLPFMQFYPADWLRDTRILSLEARGAWIDLLCAMWEAPERGKLTWTKTQFENFIGYSTDKEGATEIWNELMDSGVGDMKVTLDDNGVTLICRRIVKEEKERSQHVNRQQRYRGRKGDGDVPPKLPRIYQKSEVRSQNKDPKKEPPPKAEPVDNSKK